MIGALWIGRDQTPDWGAAARSVRDLRLATVYATGDDFFPWDTWLADVPDVPHPLGVYLALRTAQARLQSALEATRAAVERGTRHMLVAELPDHRVYVAGGQTASGPPPAPWEDFTCFAEGGQAAAAGFAGWTRSCPIDLPRRALAASARQRRSMAATRALVYAEDLAHEEQSALGKLGASTHAAWTAPLRLGCRARRADRQIRALMLFAARTYALLEELWHDESSAHELPAGVPRVVWETRDVIDETAIPRRRSHDAGAVLREALAIADTAAEDLALLDDPDSEDSKHLKRVSGRPLAHAIAIEITAHLFSWLLIALADLAGDRLAPAAAPPRREQTEQSRPAGRVVHPAYERSVAWIAASGLDLDAAARAIEAIDDDALRERLGSDLKALEPMARHEVSSEVTYESLGDMTIWFTVGETSDGRPASAALHRLGAAGVLASAGALTWSPPVP